MHRSVVGSLTFVGVLAVAACSGIDDVKSPAMRTSATAIVATPLASLSQSVPGAVPSPAGLRACFAGESNAIDVVSNNAGTLSGTAGYAPGKFGQAFDFRALGDGVTVPTSASLNVGPGPGLTMAAWIYGRGTMFQVNGGIVGAGPIMEFDNGAHLWHHNQQNDPTGLFTNLAEGNAPSQWHIVEAPGTTPLNAWHHTAVTYSKATGDITLYVDGVAVATSNQGIFSANTSTSFHIGQRVTPVIGDPSFTFNGSIDEVQVYDRGLTAVEVAQIAAATGTMCVPPPASYQVTQMPVSSGESGVPFTTQPVVAILDANGNIVSNATTPVTATVASGSGTLTGTTTVNAVNGVATFTNLAIAGAGSTTISFSAGALLPAGSSPTTSPALVTVQVPRQLGISTQPGGATSGQPLAPQPIVEVRDAAGLRVVGATNAVTASVGSGAVTLAGTATVAAVDGTAAFTNLVLSGAGAATLDFASSGLIGAASNSFNIAGLPATQLVILTQPAGAESGMPFATQPVIELRDATNARATSATGNVTAAITAGTGGTLVGTVTVPIVNGLATFPNLQINGPGTFTLRFASGSLAAVDATPITVVQLVRNLAVVAAPAVIISGQPMVPPYTIELRDAANIRVATSTFLVRMSFALGSGTISGTFEKNAVAGVVTYDDVTVTATGTVGFNFWVVDPASFPLQAYTLSNAVTAQANNTEPPPLVAALVRHGPRINSEVQGSLQLLSGDDVKLNGDARIDGTFYVPGTPTVRTTGKSVIGSTTDGTGSASPSGYEIRLNGNSSITRLTRRTNPVAMPVVNAPQAPTGTREVSLNRPSDQVGNWSTVRDLTLDGNAGSIAMPPGAYGEVTINGTAALVIGVAGATTPATYDFAELKLNGNSTLRVVGPVIVTVDDDVKIDGAAMGASGHPEWLTLRIHEGGLTLNGGVTVDGTVIAPSGSIKLTGNSRLTGGLAADDLELTGNAILRITKSVFAP